MEDFGGLVGDGVWFPQLSSFGDDYGPDGFRRERLMFVAGFMYGALGRDKFEFVHHLHDHKGDLTVTVNCIMDSPVSEWIALAASDAWCAVNEPAENVWISYLDRK